MRRPSSAPIHASSHHGDGVAANRSVKPAHVSHQDAAAATAQRLLARRVQKAHGLSPSMALLNRLIMRRSDGDDSDDKGRLSSFSAAVQGTAASAAREADSSMRSKADRSHLLARSSLGTAAGATAAQPSIAAAAALHDAAATAPPRGARRRLFGVDSSATTATAISSAADASGAFWRIGARNAAEEMDVSGHEAAVGSGEVDPDAYGVGRRAAEAIALDPAALDSLLGDVAALGAILAPPRPVEDSDAALLAAFAARAAADGAAEGDVDKTAAAERRTLRPRDEDFRDFDAPRGWHATRRAMAKVATFRENPDAAARLRERIRFYNVLGRDTRENARREHRFEALRRAQQVELDMAAYHTQQAAASAARAADESAILLGRSHSPQPVGPHQLQRRQSSDSRCDSAVPLSGEGAPLQSIPMPSNDHKQPGQAARQPTCLDFSSDRGAETSAALKQRAPILRAWDCAPDSTQVAAGGSDRTSAVSRADQSAGAKDVNRAATQNGAMRGELAERAPSLEGTAVATFGAMVRRHSAGRPNNRGPTPTSESSNGQGWRNPIAIGASNNSGANVQGSGRRVRPASASLFRVMPGAPADLAPDTPLEKPALRPLSALTWRSELQRRKREGIPILGPSITPGAQTPAIGAGLLAAAPPLGGSPVNLDSVGGVESDALAGTLSGTLTSSQRATAASAALGFIDRAKVVKQREGGVNAASDDDDDDEGVPTADQIWADAQLWYRHAVTERAPLVEVVPRADRDYWRMRARTRDERTAAVVAARDSQYQRRQDVIAARVAAAPTRAASRSASAARR